MIQNIIFDLGGVLINLDINATRRAFEAIGFVNFSAFYTQAQQSDLFDKFDKGFINKSDFIEQLQKFLPSPIEPDNVVKAWNAMLLELPAKRIELLKKVALNYKLYLLSNTNEIHIDSFEADIWLNHGIKDFSSLFEKAYYSCRIGKRKPDREIFEFVLNENSLNPTQTLFIDDSIQHIEGAKSCAIQAIHLPNTTDVVSLFDDRGMLIVE